MELIFLFKVYSYSSADGLMMITTAAAATLELTRNLGQSQANRWHSLFGVMRHTRTGMGTRLLRANIMQPSAEIQNIEARLDAVSGM